MTSFEGDRVWSALPCPQCREIGTCAHRAAAAEGGRTPAAVVAAWFRGECNRAELETAASDLVTENESLRARVAELEKECDRRGKLIDAREADAEHWHNQYVSTVGRE